MNKVWVCTVCGKAMENFKPPKGSTEGLKVSHAKCALHAAYKARGLPPPKATEL